MNARALRAQNLTLINIRRTYVQRQADWIEDINAVLRYAVAVEMTLHDDHEETLEIFAIINSGGVKFNPYTGKCDNWCGEFKEKDNG